ncbi:MAG: LemA family protein [Bacteroidales bacterium]|jgi:LemA protein|nr:LemA family protein [Bacteroidales bacterium]MDD2611506.1 LemA family protein [Bacteroidales bacterium]MDD4713185.1 LemA family protein [Bacteroidales bacterium]MEA4839684.1 LemA family protein [Bacteroidales bacterium]
MNKSTIAGLSILGIIVIVFFWGMSQYNGMVTADENVAKTWANVESQYQRRSDLIPNLVATVKGYAAHEKSTLNAVVEARAKASQTTIDPTKMTPESLAKYQAAQSEVGSTLNRLLVTVEKYPDLKANQNFLELQAQLEGTENRISVERQRFNDAAQGFNVMIRRFPKNIIAGMFGFEKKVYFEAEETASKAPQVKF